MIGWFFLGSFLAYGLVMIFYRLHVHPLSKYPGPWLAGATGLYEMYFTLGGSFEDEIDRMHQKYGPVVRITPNEVHVQEQLYHTSYADGWIKGSEALSSQLSRPSRFQTKKRSISRARSILQVEVYQIIRALVQRHQLNRLFGSFPPFIPLPMHDTRTDPEESDLEDGRSVDWTAKAERKEVKGSQGS